jgi:5-methylcytosine-specific restriction enzyme subunit McrC
MIPIRNLYFLFLYAWDKFSEGARVEVGQDEGPDLPNLLAKVLASGVRRQFRMGLDKDYVSTVEELAFPRGKFLLADTIKRSSLASGRAVCEFDELSVDTIPNRILKAAMRRLQLSPDIATDLASELRRLEARLEGVARLPLSPDLFRLLQVTRNHGQYGLLMKVCRLVMELSMPDEGGAGHRFYDILKDETRMSVVFEHFVRNFFRLEQSHYLVGAEMITWPARCVNAQDADYLPTMVTDVTLRSADRTIVIDAKYYRDTFVSRFGTRPKVRSGHLYQLQSYLTNMERQPGQMAPEGVLLYPSIDGEEVRLDFQLPLHRIRVWTVDMAQPWQPVHNQFLELVDVPRH